jgi:hypothetical protein
MSQSTIRLAAVVATLAACGPPSRRPATILVPVDSLAVDGLLLRGRSTISGSAGDTLLLAVGLENHRPEALELEYGACAIDLRLVHPDGSADRPAYAFSARPGSSMVRLNDGRLGAVYFACPAYLARASVAPGAKVSPAEFHQRTALDSVAADSLHGTFRVVARTRLLGRSFDVPAGTLRLP